MPNLMEMLYGPNKNTPMLPQAQGRTYLQPQDEILFQTWIKSLPWYKEYQSQYKEAPDLNTTDYDYRAAYQANVVPQRDPYDNNRFHWPSVVAGKEAKARNHPTAWKEDYQQLVGKDPSDPTGRLNAQQSYLLGEMLKQRYGNINNRSF